MKATLEQTTVRLIPHEESFDVRISRYFYFDDNAGRRSINGRPDRKAAQSAAQAFARAASPRTSQRSPIEFCTADERPASAPNQNSITLGEAIAAGLFEDEPTGTTIDQAAAIVAAWKREHGLPLLSPEACGELCSASRCL
ncbi:hypothetical protein [Bradyrhizobium sp. SZCCHNR1015]|uniref:hypothetical protein n=1 Tax=Bradyrhizobium sp. SZCCHNR1015 TaxID=3057338 RepID=UPI002916F9CC|nr:hypothetical protein [Bradyrhizobium sp. SZCCHNR1015]